MEDIQYYKEQLESFKDMFAMTTRHLQRTQNELKEANEAIAQSVSYANRIQSQIIPKLELDNQFFNDFYFFLSQRDNIGGDFLFAKKVENTIVFGLMDCTGHGIPGALLSIMGFNFLNDIVQYNKITSPEIALKKLDEKVHAFFETKNRKKLMQDGMDGILCSYNLENKELR